MASRNRVHCGPGFSLPGLCQGICGPASDKNSKPKPVIASNLSMSRRSGRLSSRWSKSGFASGGPVAVPGFALHRRELESIHGAQDIGSGPVPSHVGLLPKLSNVKDTRHLFLHERG